jgi:uncharacterized FAD-dependent dehydrogenase
MSTIYVTAGDNRTLPLAVTRSNVAVNLTGASVTFTATGPVTEIAKSSAVPAEAVITAPATGGAEIYLVPADTSAVVEREELDIVVKIETPARGIETITYCRMIVTP